MNKCKYCETMLVYITMPSGRIMPCEAKRIEVWRCAYGTHTAITEHGEIFKCETDPMLYGFSEYAYIPHWKNCSGADQARRRS
jgi:hypothetical protein